MWTNDGFFPCKINKIKFRLSCGWKSPRSSSAAFRPSGSIVVIMMCKWCAGWHFFHYWDNVTNESHCQRLLNDWKPGSAAQEDGGADLSLPPRFISMAQPTVVFMYFCPSSGVNKTPALSERSLGNEACAFESSAPSRSRVNLRDGGRRGRGMTTLFEKSIYMTFLCKCVYECVCTCVDW